MTTLTELIESFGNRIKSPVFGSFVISFIGFNWKPLFYVLFAKTVPQSKFYYFDEYTNFWTLLIGPIIFGTVLAIGLPYLNLVAAKAIRRPVQDRRLLEITSASDRLLQKQKLTRIRRLEEEEHDKARIAERSRRAEEFILDRQRREEELIAQAQRDQEALKIENEKIRILLKEALENSRKLSETQEKFNQPAGLKFSEGLNVNAEWFKGQYKRKPK